MTGAERRKGRGRRSTHVMFYHVAVSVDYRGENDDELTFVFRGAPYNTIVTIFRYLIGGGCGIAQGARVKKEYDIVRRIGYGYERVAAYMVQPDFRFASLDSQKILIEALLHRYLNCSVEWMDYDKFLNV